MANEKKTVWKIYDCPIYYAKVFESNRDMAEMFDGVQGIYKVTMALTPEQIQDLKDSGVPETALGYQTFKEMTIGDDQITSYVAKRPHVSKNLKDEVTGEPQFMGPPLVFDYNKAVEAWKEAGGIGFVTKDHKTPWTMEDGLIGNGTKAKVKLSIYRGKNKANKPTCVVTLEEVAIVDLVRYENNISDDEVRF